MNNITLDIAFVICATVGASVITLAVASIIVEVFKSLRRKTRQASYTRAAIRRRREWERSRNHG